MAVNNKEKIQTWTLHKDYRIQKYAIDEYLRHDIIYSIISYMFANYQLPKMTAEEKEAVWDRLESRISFKSKEIFESEKTTKNFLKFLASNFRDNGSDSFSYTCKGIKEDDLLIYVENPKVKYTIGTNKDVEKALNPLLDEKANDAALMVPEILNEIREIKRNEELELLERLAKKHNKKII